MTVVSKCVNNVMPTQINACLFNQCIHITKKHEHRASVIQIYINQTLMENIETVARKRKKISYSDDHS